MDKIRTNIIHLTCHDNDFTSSTEHTHAQTNQFDSFILSDSISQRKFIFNQFSLIKMFTKKKHTESKLKKKIWLMSHFLLNKFQYFLFRNSFESIENHLKFCLNSFFFFSFFGQSHKQKSIFDFMGFFEKCICIVSVPKIDNVHSKFTTVQQKSWTFKGLFSLFVCVYVFVSSFSLPFALNHGQKADKNDRQTHEHIVWCELRNHSAIADFVRSSFIRHCCIAQTPIINSYSVHRCSKQAHSKSPLNWNEQCKKKLASSELIVWVSEFDKGWSLTKHSFIKHELKQKLRQNWRDNWKKKEIEIKGSCWLKCNWCWCENVYASQNF